MSIPEATVDSHIPRRGFKVPDPFGPDRKPPDAFIHAFLATALFRCWHLLVFFAAWSVLITYLNEKGHKLWIQSTLLTVVGTVLGFVISYRTTSAFERYNEGRRYWSQVILANRTFARTTWFHVTDPAPAANTTDEEQAARSMIEKKSVINLLEAFAVSLKHYLRGEDGIFYNDLYYLVKHLPEYALPAGRPSMNDARPSLNPSVSSRKDPSPTPLPGSVLYQRACVSAPDLPTGDTLLPVPVTAPAAPSVPLKKENGPVFLEPLPHRPLAMPSTGVGRTDEARMEKLGLRSRNSHISESELPKLSPADKPPKHHLNDFFPFSLLVGWRTAYGERGVKGKKAARLRAKLGPGAGGGNLPLEISLYLSSYIAALQARKQDVPTINTLIAALNQLVDALTGLERILTTPIPFSYSFHLWTVTMIYCLAFPFQVWSTLKWVTVPGTIIISFIFFGFIVAGEEIENPFGYDKNDLNLGYFTHNIIRDELRALTSKPPPNPANWAFSPDNDMLFTTPDPDGPVTPNEWVKRGYNSIQDALRARSTDTHHNCSE